MGYYDLPNLLGVPGEDLPHVSHYYSEPHPYYRQRVVIVGGKNSACEAALELYRNGAHVTLVHRGETLGDSVKYWVRPDIDNRIKEGRSPPASPPASSRSGRPRSSSSRRRWPRDDCRRRRAAPDRLPRRPGSSCAASASRWTPTRWCRATIRRQFETNVANVFIAGGQLAGRADRHDLHRERAAARRAHRPGAGRAPAPLIGDWAGRVNRRRGAEWRDPSRRAGAADDHPGQRHDRRGAPGRVQRRRRWRTGASGSTRASTSIGTS